MPANRMPRSLVALSASAIAAVYMAGYLRTQSADASLGAAAVPTLSSSGTAPVAAAAPAPTATPAPQIIRRDRRPGQTAAQTQTTSPAQRSTAPNTTIPSAPTSPPQSQQSVAYRDGTYAGQGSSRRGDVWVSVQIQAGQITHVNITRSTLQYPLRDIAGLPAQVVQRQSASVDTVSRATYSSQAFRGAVAQALAAAKAA